MTDGPFDSELYLFILTETYMYQVGKRGILHIIRSLIFLLATYDKTTLSVGTVVAASYASQCSANVDAVSCCIFCPRRGGGS